MSYILEALKKLERERHLGRLPTLDTDHNLPVETRRWISLLLMGIANTIVAAVLLMIVWLRPGLLGETKPGMKSPPSAPQARAKPQVPEALRPGNAEPLRYSHPVVPDKKEPPPAVSNHNLTERKSPTRPPANSHEDREPPKSARSAGVNSRIEPKQAAIPETPDPIAQPTEMTPPPEQITRSEVDEPPARPILPPRLQQLSAETRSSLPEMRISLLAYTKSPADRMVYINGTKYQEGQMVEGKVKVEAIVPEGAILSTQGQRFLLGR